MDNLVTETKRVNAAGQRWKWMPRLGFFVGLGMMAIDLLLYFLGYSSCVFSIGGLAIWLASSSGVSDSTEITFLVIIFSTVSLAKRV